MANNGFLQQTNEATNGALLQMVVNDEFAHSFASTNECLNFNQYGKCIIPRIGDKFIPLYIMVKQTNDNQINLTHIKLYIGNNCIISYPVALLSEIIPNFKVVRGDKIYYKFPNDELKLQPILLVCLLYMDFSIKLDFSSNEGIIDSKLYGKNILMPSDERGQVVANIPEHMIFQVTSKDYEFEESTEITEMVNLSGNTNGFFIKCHKVKEIEISLNNTTRIKMDEDEIFVFAKKYSDSLIFIPFNYPVEYNNTLIEGSLNLSRLNDVCIKIKTEEPVTHLEVYSFNFNTLKYSAGMAGVVHTFDTNIEEEDEEEDDDDDEDDENDDDDDDEDEEEDDNEYVEEYKVYSSDDICAITSEEIGENTRYMQCSTCTKPFYKDELLQWFIQQNDRKCPICRSQWDGYVYYINSVEV